MPPKKGKKMNLDAFLMDETTGGSWADEMDALPTGPSGIPSQPGGLGGSHLSRGNRDDGFGGGRSGGFGDDRPMRQEVPIPNAPPYTAFVGNLSFDASEGELADFFGGQKISSIRLVSGFDGKPKGFGYVEFETVDDLKAALALSGSDMAGRQVRLSVAEAPKAGAGREGRADEETTWSRSGPLAALPGRSGGGGFDRAPRERSEGFGSSRDPDGPEVERDGPIRGGKFVASQDPPRRAGGFDRPGGFDRVPSSGPREFQAAPQVEVEREGPIRGGKFQPSAPAPERTGGFGAARSASGSGGAEEKTWSRAGPLPPVQRAPGSFGSRTPPTSGESTPTGGAPAQRQRLQLSARSTSTSDAASSPSASSSSSKPSPFGAAKPVDNASRQAEVDAKLAKEREESQKKFAEERERKDREKREGASQKDKDREESLAKARMGAKPAPAAASPSAPSEETKVEEKKEEGSANKAERKEGFSYAASAVAAVKDAVVDVTEKVKETVL